MFRIEGDLRGTLDPYNCRKAVGMAYNGAFSPCGLMVYH